MIPVTTPQIGGPAAPLPPELAGLLRRMRLPHMRKAAPDVLATAKAQRWDPAEVLRVLLAEEVAGRERSALATRRAAAGFPAIAGSAMATTGDVAAHIDIGLHGRPGTAMAAFGPQLSDAELAAIITYQRNAWGNATGDLVTPADIAAAR